MRIYRFSKPDLKASVSSMDIIRLTPIMRIVLTLEGPLSGMQGTTPRDFFIPTLVEKEVMIGSKEVCL